jgi:tetratricopeptide (TPR) repeat protein
MRFARFIASIAVALALTSCSPAPEKILKRGNEYYDRGKYREASIMYRNAVVRSPKFGEAYYHLGLASMKLNQLSDAVSAFRRAQQLLPAASPDQMDASIKYAEILLTAAPSLRSAEQARTLDEVREIKDTVLKHDPNSFEGTRLFAALTLNDALVLTNKHKEQEARETLESAIGIYRQALTLKQGDSGVMIALADSLVMHGDADEAERMYRQVIEKDKTLLVPYQELYKFYVNRQRMPDAEDILKRAIATHPAEYSLQIQLARHYFLARNPAEMTQVLDVLKSHFKSYPEAFMKAGDFYFLLGDTDQAIRQYQEGMSNDLGRRVDYQKRVIQALVQKGRADEAFRKNQEILKANPADPEARAFDGKYLLDKGENDKAIVELQSVTMARPDDYVALSNLGRAYFAKKDLALATQHFEAVLKVKPDYVPALEGLAEIALLRGDPDSALTLTQNTLKMFPDNGNAVFLQATAYVNKVQPDKARPLLEQLVKLNPSQAGPLIELAQVSLLEKRNKEAEELFRKAYQADPSDLRGLLGLSEIRMRMNDPAGAIQVIVDEVKKHPQRADIRRSLANLELRTKQYDKAIGDYRWCLDANKPAPSEQALLYERIGISYEAKGDFQNGLDNYRKARQLEPSNIYYARHIADLLDQMGRTEEAIAAYRDTLRIDPHDAIVMNNMAYAMAKGGQNLDEALSLAQKAKQQLPNLDDASDTIGWIYIRKNLSDSAVEIFRSLTAKVKDNPTYHYHYGVALAQKGDKANAQKELRTALQNNPNKGEVNQIKELLQKIS